MLQGSFEHVGDDLHVAMRMRGKAIAGLHPVLVNNPQAAKSHKVGIEVVCERKRVICIQPAMVGMAAFLGPSYLNHCPPTVPLTSLPVVRWLAATSNNPPIIARFFRKLTICSCCSCP